MKLLIILFIVNLSYSQTVISGSVHDESGKALEYVNVYIKGKLTGANTNSKGEFSFISQDEGFAFLIVSFTGYKMIEEKILLDGKKKSLKFVLKEAITRDDIVEITSSAFITDGDKKLVTARPIEVVTTPGAAADINRYFQTLPGVSSVDEGAGLFVRGGNVQETVMQLDGATLYHPYKFESPSGGFFGTITPFLTKGSSFYTGALPAKYGNVLSGMVDMESNDLVDKSQYTFGVGLAAISTRIDQVIQAEKTSISFSSNYSDTEALMKFNDNKYAFKKYPKNYDINLNLNHNLSKSDHLKLFIFRESNEVGAQIVQPGAKKYYSGNATNDLVNLVYKGSSNENLLYQANFAYTDYSNTNGIGAGGSEQSDEILQFKLNADYLLGDISSLSAGVDLRRLEYNYDGNWHFHPDSTVQGIAGQHYSENKDIQYFASYLQFKLPINKELLFRIGSRLEYENQSETIYIDPRLSVAYQANKSLIASLSYGRYHQIPQLNNFVNNPNLIMNQSEGITFGLNYNLNNTLIVKAETYYRSFDHLIKKSGSEDERRFNNSGYGHASGFDLLYKQKFDMNDLSISYSYLDAKRNDGYFVKLTSPEFDITHNFTIISKQELIDNLSLGIKYVYRSGKPYKFSAIATEFNSKRLPDYERVDANLSYLTTITGSDLTVFYFSVSNLFANDNILNRRYNSDYTISFDQKSSFDRSYYFGFSTTL